MINEVRTAVLAILNKSNYGYLNPSDFNLYCKLVQIDLFTDAFKQYNSQINQENIRMSGSDLADMKDKKQLDIATFSRYDDLTKVSGSTFYLPSVATTGYDLYKIEEKGLWCYDGLVTPRVFKNYAEKAEKSKFRLLNSSLNTAPSVVFPVYIVEGNTLTVYPTVSAFSQTNSVECHYIRMPKDPKWTYLTITDGDPIFDATASDYQDFELGSDEFPMLVVKICQLAGVEIRESDVFSFSKNEQVEKQKDQ